MKEKEAENEASLLLPQLLKNEISIQIEFRLVNNFISFYPISDILISNFLYL